MNKMLFAVALSIAIPAVASAQKFPVPTSFAPVEAKQGCCAKMKAKMDCCKDRAMKKSGGDSSHSGHDMSPSMPSHQH